MINFRKATEKDLPTIIALLADDDLGKSREVVSNPLSKAYLDAFKIIDADANQELMVLENENQEILGTFQMTYIQYLNRMGGLRAQIEAVMIKKDMRGHGLGKILFAWAINRAKERNAQMLQLTTDKKRPDARRFYENLGFTATHEGMKMEFPKE